MAVKHLNCVRGRGARGDRPFREVVSERIIAPLGLKDTTWSGPEQQQQQQPSRLAIGEAMQLSWGLAHRPPSYSRVLSTVPG